MEADAIIDHLGLAPHPEGGWFAETWRHDPGDGTLVTCTVSPALTFETFELAPPGFEPGPTAPTDER